jgi:TonB family protein
VSRLPLYLALSAAAHTGLAVAVLSAAHEISPRVFLVDLVQGLAGGWPPARESRPPGDAGSPARPSAPRSAASRPTGSSRPAAARPAEPPRPVEAGPEPVAAVEPTPVALAAAADPTPAEPVAAPPVAPGLPAGDAAGAPGGEAIGSPPRATTGGRGVGGGEIARAGDGPGSGRALGGREGSVLALAAPGAGGADAAEYAAYLALVRRRIQESLAYPAAARRRGLAGTVVVELEIEPSGAIASVVLAASSTHPALDEAALGAVRDVGRVPFPADVRPRRLRVRLPIVFDLR